MIPNPKKTFTIDFTAAEVKAAIMRIPSHLALKYQMHDANDVFSNYTLSALEFLSAGVFVDIHVNAVSDLRSEITIEVRRKIGAFDQWHEVQNANQHIVALTSAMTQLIQNGRDPVAYPLSTPVIEAQPPVLKQLILTVLVGLVVLALIFWIVGRMNS